MDFKGTFNSPGVGNCHELARSLFAVPLGFVISCQSPRPLSSDNLGRISQFSPYSSFSFNTEFSQSQTLGRLLDLLVFII